MTEWRHGGNVWQVASTLGCSVEEIIDFSSSVNPFGPPEWVYSLIDSTKAAIKHYPDPFCSALRKRVARYYGISEAEILPGNGTSELLYLLPRALNPAKAVIPVPSYVDYEYGARAAGLRVVRIAMQANDNFRLPTEELHSVLGRGDIVYIGRPNNPTGLLYDGEQIRHLALDNRDTYFVVDQAFYDFAQDEDPLVKGRPRNVILLFSLTKILAIPGIRIGWAVADPQIIEAMRQAQAPWSVNVLAQVIGEKAFDHKDGIAQSAADIAKAREKLLRMTEELEDIIIFPSKVNYLLGKICKDGIDAHGVQETLLQRHRILIRTCDNFASLDKKFFRICIRSNEDNALLVEALRQALEG